MKKRRCSGARVAAVVMAATLATAGCHHQAASAAACAAVLDRLIDLELTESGYRDPIVRARWHDELSRRFAPDLARCRGLAVGTDLPRCLASAHTSGEITHRCLE
jgi:hypothetical protein